MSPSPPPTQSGLTVAKTVDTAQIQRGGRLQYVIHVRATGPASAQDVVLLDVPGGVTGADVRASTGTCSVARTVVCRLGALAAGETATVRIGVTAARGGLLCNVAAVSADSPTGAPGVPHARACTRVTSAVTSLSKRANRAVVAPGGAVTYTLTARGHGPQAARDARLCDLLPPGLALVRARGAHADGHRVCWSLGTLAAGSRRSVQLTARVRASSATRAIRNRARLTSPQARAESASATVRRSPPAVTG